MDAFSIVMTIFGAVIGLCLVANLILILACRRETSRAVLADAVFYPMVALFIIYTLVVDTSIAYEVVLLAGLLGVLSTLAVARIITKGGR